MFSLDSAKTFVEDDWEGEITSAVKQLKEKCWYFGMNYQYILKFVRWTIIWNLK